MVFIPALNHQHPTKLLPYLTRNVHGQRRIMHSFSCAAAIPRALNSAAPIQQTSLCRGFDAMIRFQYWGQRCRIFCQKLSNFVCHCWECLEIIVALFNGSDSILIETPLGSVSGHQNQKWACFVGAMVGKLGNRRREARSLGSVIVGNEMSEY